MLEFPNQFCEDKKASEMIKKYYNDRLAGMIRDIMLMYCPDGYEGIKENDMEFADSINLFFPMGYPAKKMTSKFLGLYALLQAEDAFVPELIMEYLLDAVISTNLEVWEDVDISPVEPMPDREYVLEQLRKDYDGEEISGDEVLSRIEDLRNYEDYCFWDIDFELLNYMSLKEEHICDTTEVDKIVKAQNGCTKKMNLSGTGMKLGAIVLDSDNIEELSDFYARMLGWTKSSQIHEGEKWITVIKEDYSETPFVFQENPDYKRPIWPSDKEEQQQMIHLDFYVCMDEFESKIEHAIKCGAKMSENQFSNSWKVMIDISGHPFCMIPIPKEIYEQRYG